MAAAWWLDKLQEYKHLSTRLLGYSLNKLWLINGLTEQVHEAYIELVKLLEPSDPRAAVEVYCSFPLKPVAEQRYDDAFITAEIVRILMELELYEHPQLGPNLAAYGKVMGLSNYCYYYWW